MDPLDGGEGEVSIRVAGAISGVIFLRAKETASHPTACASPPSGRVTVGELRAEVQRLLSPCGSAQAASCLLLLSGKRLTNDSQTLLDAGVGSASRILVMRGAAPVTTKGALAAPGSSAAAAGTQEVEDARRDLDRIRRGAEAMAAREIATGSSVALQLESQNGKAVQVGSPEERKALITALILAEKGHATMTKGDFSHAAQELLLAEEFFAKCDLDKMGISNIDNKAMLLIDLVWCWFKLQDRSCLASAAKRLQEARQTLAKSHGENFERMRVLHGDFRPELATYVRLELLEGVGLLYQGDCGSALTKLKAARAKWQSLAVSDEGLAQLTGMGFTAKEASRALRFCSGDVERSVECVMKQRQACEDARKRSEEQRRRQREQLRYGRTQSGKPVDMDRLEFLASSGHERSLAAEALRQTENDQWAALDILSNEISYYHLQTAMAVKASTRKQKNSRSQSSFKVSSEQLAELMALGFGHGEAHLALQTAGGDVREAAEALLSHSRGGKQPTTNGAEGSEGANCSSAGAQAELPTGDRGKEVEGEEGGKEEDEEEAEEAIDAEMESILSSEVRTDPMDAYDVEVSEEGAAITEFLAKVESLMAPTTRTDASPATGGQP